MDSFTKRAIRSTVQKCPKTQCTLWVWVNLEENKNLVSGARVMLSGPSSPRGQVPKTGPCIFQNLPPGTYSISVSATSVKGMETSIVVTDMPYQVTIAAGELGTATIWISLHKVSIKLVDSKDQPVPDAAYEMVVPDGRTIKGTLKPDGSRRVAGIPQGDCKVHFPDYDKDLIELVSSVAGT
jgi:hypothetical protein